MVKDPELRAHLEWLGYVQPVGLVVSPPALLNAQAHINRNIVPEHRRFLECLGEVDVDGGEQALAITNFPSFVQKVFGWEPEDLLGGPGSEPPPADLEINLTEYNETLRPTYVVREFDAQAESAKWLMLIKELPIGTGFEKVRVDDDRRWQASPQSRFERLLRETEVPIGLLVNGTILRLVYAPRGETSGYATFQVQEMAEVAGRPIFAALHLLLSSERLFSLPGKQRLPAILAESRKYQNDVSTKLAEQVLASLYELLRGFQAADDLRHGELLREVLRNEPNQVYAGLLTVLLRLVFILYAEDRGLLSNDRVFVNNYSVTALFERLRDDANQYPDTMDQRYGAWAQLLTLFRLVFDGADHKELHLPPRHGYLFNSDRYPFLEGRPWQAVRQLDERVNPPMVSDGVVFRVLQNLLILEGERLSYRSLDVEQIGSVYETIMGFSLEVSSGRSIAIKPKKAHGAPTTINLDELLKVERGERAKWLLDNAEQKITGKVLNALMNSNTAEDIVEALDRKVASAATPNIVPRGAMILQPSDERRRSGSHYTPRSLTEPIVRTTLKPVLEQLGHHPKPEEILELKVCDPAMGSGAFLVEACRQLGDALVNAWSDHKCIPIIPPDEDEVLHARRLVAQRCLYGVDKNPLATDLAKLSLWLATLATDHAFTFLDHALRTGDSLVGLRRNQIAGFHWEPTKTMPFVEPLVEERLTKASGLRLAIQTAEDEADEASMRLLLMEVDETLDDVRLVGDLVISAFFRGISKTEREGLRRTLAERVEAWLTDGKGRSELLTLAEEMRRWDKPVLPFHWEIEFPEVFGRRNPGFDAMVGNPPYAHKNSIVEVGGGAYIPFFQSQYELFHGYSDLGTYFIRRAHTLSRSGGAWTLVCTNTVTEGKACDSGLRYVVNGRGEIIDASSSIRWPGTASVVVCAATVFEGEWNGARVLDGRVVERIQPSLRAGQDAKFYKLHANAHLASTGFLTYGRGFLVDLDSAVALINEDPRNREVVVPLLSASDLADCPVQKPSAYVIDFGTRTEAEASSYVGPFQWVVKHAKPEREEASRQDARQRWWRLVGRAERTYAMADKKHLTEVLANLHVSKHHVFVRIPRGVAPEKNVNVFALSSDAAFAVLQSRVHALWADERASSLETRRRYTPTTCFATFPFPECRDSSKSLGRIGGEYYRYRADLMIGNNEGLTTTYNRFHDPDERSPDIIRLRDLHAEMDQAVIEAYDWPEIQPTCEFLLDGDLDDEDGKNGRSRNRKKPWHYRWPDEICDDVLAHLYELNQQRAKKEQFGGSQSNEGSDLSGATLPFANGEEAI